MKKYITALALGGLLLLPALTPAQAQVFTSVDKTHQLDETPIDIASSANGKYTFMLMKGGKVEIFSDTGQRDEAMVDSTMDRISTNGEGDKIFVSSSSTKKFQEVYVDFVQNIDISGNPFLGNENAPVVVVAFSDFQCPYCAKLGATFEKVLEQYPDQVKIVFKHFPLGSHRFAANAALAATAAQEQGKFWQYHDLLFENFRELNNDSFTKFAQQLGLNMPMFSNYMSSQAAKDKVIKDHSNGREAGVGGTPAVFINGRRLRQKTLPGFQKLIDQELKKFK